MSGLAISRRAMIAATSAAIAVDGAKGGHDAKIRTL